MNDLSVHFSSETILWETPQWLFDSLRREFPIMTDVCALPENAKCERFFTPEMDGLRQKWSGFCWMNPPYGREIGKWVAKAYRSAAEGDATVVCLLPSRTDTRWWHGFCQYGEIRFLGGRVYFEGPSNNDEPRAPFPSAIVIFHAHLDPGGIVKHVSLKPPTDAEQMSLDRTQGD